MNRFKWRLSTLLLIVATLAAALGIYVSMFQPPTEYQTQYQRAKKWSQTVEWIPDNSQSIVLSIHGKQFVISTAPLIVNDDSVNYDGAIVLPTGFFMVYPMDKRAKGIEEAFRFIREELQKHTAQH